MCTHQFNSSLIIVFQSGPWACLSDDVEFFKFSQPLFLNLFSSFPDILQFLFLFVKFFQDFSEGLFLIAPHSSVEHLLHFLSFFYVSSQFAVQLPFPCKSFALISFFSAVLSDSVSLSLQVLQFSGVELLSLELILAFVFLLVFLGREINQEFADVLSGGLQLAVYFLFLLQLDGTLSQFYCGRGYGCFVSAISLLYALIFLRVSPHFVYLTFLSANLCCFF